LGIERVGEGDVFARLEEDWRSLQERGGAATFFQSWEWNRCWWNRFGSGPSGHFLRFHRGGAAVGIAPCYVRGPLISALRWVGSGNADYLGLVALPEERDSVARGFADYLATHSPALLADLHQIREDDPLARFLARHAVEQAGTNRLQLPPTWGDYAASLTAKMRSNLKRAKRDLDTAGAVIRLAGGAETRQAMEAFFRLHSHRWRKRGLPGSFLGAKVKGFHLDWTEVAAERDWLRLIVLELDGRIRAVLYGLRFGDVFSYFQAGFDPEVAALSPGASLVAFAIQHAIEEGCTGFDFLRGQERYKSRWKPQDVGRNVRIVMPLGGWLGKAGCRWHRNVHAVEQRIRQRFEGGSLLKAPGLGR
jgi:CelD/BcsL family acetyltransferase involved in cellulose biosynthesis